MRNRLESESQIESYMIEVAARFKSMPVDVKEQELLEVRQHIDALIAANEELGLNRQEAVASAINQFGKPSQIGKGLAKSWRRGIERHLPGTPASAIGWCSLVSLLACVASLAISVALPLNPNLASNTGYILARMYGIGLLFSFAGGLVTGLKAPRFAFKGVTIVWAFWRTLSTMAFYMLAIRGMFPEAIPIILIHCASGGFFALCADLLGAQIGRKRFNNNYIHQITRA